MAKIGFNKLNLSLNKEEEKFMWEGNEILVRQYLPIEEKLHYITDVLNAVAASDPTARTYNRLKLAGFSILYIVKYYTNITFTEKQLENPSKLIDLLDSSGLYDMVEEKIPEREFQFLRYYLTTTVESLEQYQNSIYGIMDAMNNDYKNLDFDIEKLQGDISNPENLTLLKDIMTRLG